MLSERPVFGYEYEGVRYDCGSKEGLFAANVDFGKKYHNL